MKGASGLSAGRSWNRRRLTALAAVLLLAPCAARADAPEGANPPLVAAGTWSESVALASGAELVTVFASADDGGAAPLVSVLNDTLGDATSDNDRVRYVWVYSYVEPTLAQRVLAAIPFFYFGSPGPAPKRPGPPPVVYDFSRDPASPWRSVLWYAAQAAVLEPAGWLVEAGAVTYSRNERELRAAHLRNALSVLEAARSEDDDLARLLDDDALAQVYSGLVGGGFAGLFLTDAHLASAYGRETAAARQRTARNWELLRQRCEEEGLFFDPLPAGAKRPRHATVWVAADEVERSAPTRAFDGRFLNVASPWSDERLRGWSGYTKTYYTDAEGRYLREPEPGARPVEMIPLAVYGLDFPKIPALLVDFRSVLNPKSREISRRVREDVGRLLRGSPFGGLKLELAQKLYSTVLRRKGSDVDQPSRAASYAQLRSLLLLQDELDPQLRDIVVREISQLSANPLEIDHGVDRHASREQHAALMRQALSGELDRRIEDDRGREMVAHAHGRAARFLLGVARVATLGLVAHRDDSPEVLDRYATARSLERHAALLERVAAAPPPVEVTWAPERYRPSLEFVALHGAGAGSKLTRAVASIFERSSEYETRELALDALHRIDTRASRDALARIAADPTVAAELRERSTGLLAVRPVPPPASGATAPTVMVTPALRP